MAFVTLPSTHIVVHPVQDDIPHLLAVITGTEGSFFNNRSSADCYPAQTGVRLCVTVQCIILTG
jgi:hypothetical protein